MKKWLVLILCISFLVGCGVLLVVSHYADQVAQTDASVRKYDEMAPFFNTGCVFVSGTLDVDLSILSCTFKEVKSQELLLELLVKDGWQITQQENNKVVLERDYKRDSSGWRGKEKMTLGITFENDGICKVVWR